MNGLQFNSEYNIIKLTPLKLALCNMIKFVIKNSEECLVNFSPLLFFEIFYEISNEYECEVSKEKLFNFLHIKLNQVNRIKTEKNILPVEDFFIFFKNETEKCFNNIQSLNELYTFFNHDIKDLKTKNENGQSLTENGGLIDYFIRKCLFSFFKLSFEDLSILFTQCKAYLNGENISLNFTSTESDIIFEKQLNLLEKMSPSELINKQVLCQLNSRHQAYIKSKLNSTINELFTIHQYFDYNMKNMYNDTLGSETKIHYSLMSLVEFYTKKLYYDKAIEGKLF
jgi:hypothetical protein